MTTYTVTPNQDMIKPPRIAEEKLPGSARAVMEILEDHEPPRTFSEISSQVAWAPRTVRNALRRLIEEGGFVVRKFNFTDARQVFYLRP
ncbi:MarR family winged helix-turn-helix transcriptional regulator [Methanogenium cariaci]|uniref:MarR family winged helix-turn-helix transcriptional regulator n=1 Tax=Methanogenium cariaci TaxID=2197 RepID=UPI001FE1F50F|nr:MarR family winged helix-turn-helix transcriptional regulator [Methanogenium cariaci]